MFLLDAELFPPFEIQEDAGVPTYSNTETCLEWVWRLILLKKALQLNEGK